MPLPPIQDYAIIGNCRSAALVSRAGSIDWLCWPRFDSPSLFGRLIDEPHGGYFQIVPIQPFSSRRRYLDRTNVLETEFQTESGRCRIIDFMPVATDTEKNQLALPEHELLRLVRCDQGSIGLSVVFDPRPDYGRRSVRLTQHGRLGLRGEIGRGELLTLQSRLAFQS